MIGYERIKQRAKFLRPVFIPFVIYLGMLVGAMFWLPKHDTSPWRYLVVLVPMIPGSIMALMLVRAIGKFDEMEKRIIIEAAAFSFVFTFLFTTSMSFLETVGIHPLSGIYVNLFMVIFLIIGKFLGNWRYR